MRNFLFSTRGINFWEYSIYEVRVGWIDPIDWEPQKSPTGQMAGLKNYVYDYKLLSLVGEYYLEAPLQVISGVGEKSLNTLRNAGINLVGDIIIRLRSRYKSSALPSATVLKEILLSAGVDTRSASRMSTTMLKCPYFRRAWNYVTHDY